MTKTLNYYKEFIEATFKCNRFQIWVWRTYSERPFLIFGDRDLMAECPVFDETISSEEKQHVFYYQGHTNIQFEYTYGTRVIVRLFQPNETIEEKSVTALYYFLESIDLNETIKLRNREIKNVLNSTLAITSSLNLNTVLESIIKNITHVLWSTDAGHLMLYDPDTERLVVEAQVGFDSSITDFTPKVGESITGRVFKTGKVLVCKNQSETINTMLDNGISQDNYSVLLEAENFSCSGIICVPVEIHGTRIGVLTMHKSNPTAIISDQTIHLLEGFASQAGIAIQNAYLHEQMSERLETISSLNRELQQSYDIQTQLTKISMENKGLEHIIQTISKLISQPFVFYNATDQSFYSTSKNDLDYSWITSQDIQKHFEKNKDPVYWTAQKTRQELYLYPIYNQSLFLGCFIILDHSELTRSDQVVIEQSSTVLALELMKTQTMTNMYYRRSHEQFTALLEAESTEELFKKGENLNLSPDNFYIVAILKISSEHVDLQEVDMAIYQIILQIKQAFPHNKKILYGQHNSIFLLLSVQEKDELQSVYDTFCDIKDNCRYPFKGGLSNIYQGLEKIKSCYDEATKTLEYLDRRKNTQLLRYEEMGLDRLFINQSSYEIDKFVNEIFSIFSEDDRYKHLEETLLTYIKMNQAPTKTAKALNIHINTVYQRLDKIQEMLECDFNNPEDLLNVQLACHLKQTRKELR